MSQRSRTRSRRRSPTATPDVEVLLAEVVGGGTLRLFVDHPDGVTLEVCERVTRALEDVRERYALEVSSPGSQRPLTKPTHFRRFLGRRARVRTREAARRATSRSPASSSAPPTPRSRSPPRPASSRSRTPKSTVPTWSRSSQMSREILEAMSALAREKGIAPEKLQAALEDALLSAYKKQPDSAKYARVELDPETRRLPRHRAARARPPRGAPDRRDDRREHLPRRGDGRVRRARERRDRPGEVRGVRGPDRGAGRHARTTSAASPRRPPSRSSCSGSARPSGT